MYEPQWVAWKVNEHFRARVNVASAEQLNLFTSAKGLHVKLTPSNLYLYSKNAV